MCEPVQRHEAVIAGVRLSYIERVGKAGAQQTPLLMLHGLIATGESFAQLIARLPADRRVIALDLPGAGFSERSSKSDVSFAGIAESVRLFMQNVGLIRPVLLGHSHGGACALRLATSYPELFDRLILIAPAHPWSGKERAIIAFYLSPVGRRLAQMAPNVPEPLHWWAFLRMTGPKGKRDRSTLHLYRTSGKIPGTVERTLRLISTWHADMAVLRSDLLAEPIELPALVLWGDHDRVVPLKTAAALEQHLTQVEHITLSGIGHLPSEEAADVCGDAICAWLQKLAVSSRV